MNNQQFNVIRQRVNNALNFFSDTTGIDYCEGLSAAEIMQEDKINSDSVADFNELRKLGY